MPQKSVTWIFGIFPALCVLCIIIGILLSGCSTSLSVRVPAHPSVKGQPAEINELHRRMAKFIQAWYWKKDQRAFWQMVSRNGHLNRIDNENVFFDAFTKPLDMVFLGNRDMSAEPMAGIWEETAEAKRLNRSHRSFAIVHMPIARDGIPNPDTPPKGALSVFYAIQGDGFATQALELIWVLEDGTWMVWDIKRLVNLLQ